MYTNLPVSPAPNKEVIIAIPWTNPSATAKLLPNKVPIPEVRPGKISQTCHDLVCGVERSTE